MFDKGNGTQKVNTLFEQLKAYGESDYYPFHMPGHKRNQKLAAQGLPVSIDITEISGFDNLHHAEGIIKEEQAFAAKLYGAKKSYFLVNGSTCGILSAISAAVSEGETLLIARNCHKSVYHAAYLRKIKLEYLMPEMDPLGFPKAITKEAVSKALDENADIGAVLITSPTYEGFCSDITAIARICHSKQIPLIIDEAHGAHFGFDEHFPKSAISCGADYVIQSLHKTLPSLTQTAILHTADSLFVRAEKLERFLAIYQTSSPSYVFMGSISNCLHSIQKKDFTRYAQRLSSFYQACQTFRFIKLYEEEKDIKDVGKLIIYDCSETLLGPQLFEILREQYHLELELSMQKYVLGMTSICDEEQAFTRLFDALKQIDESIEAASSPKNDLIALPLPKKQLELYEAMDTDAKTVALDDSVGEVICEYIYLYPPGYPVIVPGERMDEAILGYIMNSIKLDMNVQGPADTSLQTVKVAR